MFQYETDQTRRPAEVHHRPTMLLLAILCAVAAAFFLLSPAFAGEPHSKPPREVPVQPAAPVIHVTPTYAAPSVSAGSSAQSGANAAAQASPSQSINTKALAIGAAAAVSPGTCDSTVLNGLWTKESWTCALLSRIRQAAAMNLGEVVIELMCMDELFRAALVRNSANKDDKVCANQTHPASRYNLFELDGQSGGL